MKKIAFTGFVVSMLLGSAFADTVDSSSIVPLTTKNYVDDGLRYVYDKKADKEDVYTKQESDAKYLTSTDIAEIDGTKYIGKNGISIAEHQVGLNVNAQEGSMYVYTSGGWVELPVRNQWNPDMLIPSEDD